MLCAVHHIDFYALGTLENIYFHCYCYFIVNVSFSLDPTAALAGRGHYLTSDW